MSNKLEIKKDDAIKAHSEATPKGKALLENLLGKSIFLTEVTERIKNFDDVLAETGKSKEDFENSCNGLEPDEVAYKKAKLVCLAFNEGWVPDWTNGNEGKYAPYFKMGSSAGLGFSYYDCVTWRTNSTVGSRLCFKSSKLAITAGRLFEQEIYKPLFTI